MSREAPGGVRPPTPLLDVSEVSVDYDGRRRLVRGTPRFPAIRGVSFSVRAGETLGMVGESGAGKTTIARAIIGLTPVASGSISLAGRSISSARGKDLREIRHEISMVFQDPYSSLNPRFTVGDSVGLPLRIHTELGSAAIRRRVAELFELVGLGPAHVDSYPHEFSGGQLQRIAIARALATNPRLVICDEAVSALDVSTQNQIIHLLKELQAETGMAMLFIAHDLGAVASIAQEVLVMYLGKVVEHGPTSRMFASPQHPYTQALLAAVPSVHELHRDRVTLGGEAPSVLTPPSGCAFHTRCPHVMERCVFVPPTAVDVPHGGRSACHLNGGGANRPTASRVPPD